MAVSVRAGLVYHVEGQVWAGETRLDPHSLKLRQLGNGETLETGRGRAEALLGPGQFVRLSPRARMTLISDAIAAPEFRLERGSAIVSWQTSAGGKPIAVRAAASGVTILKPGIYRLDASDASDAHLRVFEGKALFGGNRAVSSKRELDLAETARPEKFDPEHMDGFDRWSRRRDRIVARESKSGSGRRLDPHETGVPPASERTDRLPRGLNNPL